MELIILLKFFLSFAIPSTVWANKTIENQRKYEFNFRTEEFFKLNRIFDFQIHKHSHFVSEDIYFDTKDQALRKIGLTLRIRRTIKNGVYSYLVQLKTEKKLADIPRQELDYSQLDFQKLDQIKIKETIDFLLEKKDSRKQIEILQKWIASKVNSTILPFVFLKRQNIKLDTIQATLQCYSERERFFVYSDLNHQIDGVDYAKTKDRNDLPNFFKRNSSLIWLMEGSFDKSTFYFAGTNTFVGSVTELELENKVKPAKFGNRVLDIFENRLAKIKDGEFKLIPKYKSKYLQMIEAAE